MTPRTLDEWLRRLEAAHPRAIELGLDRVGAVAARMGLDGPGCPVITVGGTNGKGSCVAYLESMLQAGGYRVGAYTSPHLLRFNERVRVAGAQAPDDALIEAFARVESARQGTALTYFEHTTLAAVALFRDAGVDAAVLEVGLGGRLDAVNLFDPDVALITTVAHDHMDWLGDDLDGIAREKAGILRAGRPAVYGDPAPRRSLLTRAVEVGARLACAGVDYRWTGGASPWSWQGLGRSHEGLPETGITGDVQRTNAAAAVAALVLAADRLPLPDGAVARGIADARLAGRFQVLSGPVPRVLDVAHNPQAAAGLARNLAARVCPGRTRLVLAMLGDKDHGGVVAALAPAVDAWYLAGLEVPRGAAGGALAEQVRRLAPGAPLGVFDWVQEAHGAALAESRPGDRVVVCGSFFTVAAVLALESAPA